MNSVQDVKNLLEWYILSGVSETCGDVCLKVFDQPAQSSFRQATTDLSQNKIASTQNARELCSKAESLDELDRGSVRYDGRRRRHVSARVGRRLGRDVRRGEGTLKVGDAYRRNRGASERACDNGEWSRSRETTARRRAQFDQCVAEGDRRRRSQECGTRVSDFRRSVPGA